MVMKSSVPTQPTFTAKSALWLAVETVALGLSACSSAPYVDSRREAGQTGTVGASNPNRAAICYSSLSTTPAAVMKLAESECAKTGRIPQFSHQESAACTLAAPTRAFFSCVAKS